MTSGWLTWRRRGALDEGNRTIGVLAAIEGDHRRVAPAADLGQEEINVDPSFGKRLGHGVPQTCAVVAFNLEGADDRLAKSGRLRG